MGITNYPISKGRDKTYWFLEVSSLLNVDNWRQEDFVPTVTGFGGVPHTYDAYFDRKGPNCFVQIIVDGTSSTVSATITNLPYAAIKDGLVTIVNITDNALIGYGSITEGTKVITLPNWSVASKKLLISSTYLVRGF